MSDRGWNGENFRNKMQSMARSSQRYSDQQSYKLKHGPANASARTRDEYLGEADAYDYFSTSASTKSPTTLIAEVDNRAARVEGESEVRGIEHIDAYRFGYKGALEHIRTLVKPHLE
ncbi:hypothetical protein [Sinorhizobium meliloti]|uniref:hypothetical protein n=1 Tax=Rhizobium meliloti TaxID=382 RepID=UPI000FD88D01|nr:hypothetical protein [Sinorhizobium meliloti]MDW9476988.1 hypothetical protein [Sinorhizobium meliloti]RVP15603.1 hypothetical protein CN080_32995 [Sinorhizobium meliloti]